MMTASKRVLLASLTTAIVIAACSDAATVTTQPGPASSALGKTGDSAYHGSGSAGIGAPGTQGDTAPPGTHPPPMPVWPRSVLGTIYGVTYTPAGPDTVATELVAGAKVDLYIVPTPVPPAYDSLPPVFYATTTSNTAGEFMFRDLAQAQYQLRVTPPEGSPYQAKTVWFSPQSVLWKMGVSLYR